MFFFLYIQKLQHLQTATNNTLGYRNASHGQKKHRKNRREGDKTIHAEIDKHKQTKDKGPNSCGSNVEFKH